MLHALEETNLISELYGLNPSFGPVPRLLDDVELIKNVLVQAVAGRHLETPSEIPQSRIESCVEFLSDYHNVFTTNYDLLLYWVEMSAIERLGGRDGFRSPPSNPDAEYLEFHERVRDEKGIFFLHGALHLFVEDGRTRKQSWNRTGTRLTTLIREGLAAGRYPLFVAEGAPQRKREQIARNGYLAYALGKLERIGGPLITFGMSFGESDQHLGETIADARDISRLFVGVFPEEGTEEASAIVRACEAMQDRRAVNMHQRSREYRVPLEVSYFDAKTVNPWGS